MKLEQDARYRGNDWWSWSIRLVGPKSELAAVASVTYFLHPTFPNPVVDVKNRRNGFRLEAGGWGTFTVRAHVKDAEGKVLVRLKHDLDLEYPESESSGKAKSRRKPVETPSVFISHSAADTQHAESLMEFLRARGFRPHSSQDVKVGTARLGEIANVIGDASSVAAIISEPPSRWVEAEIGEAMRRGKRVVPVLIGRAQLPPSAHGLQAIQVSSEQFLEHEVGMQIAQALTPKVR